MEGKPKEESKMASEAAADLNKSKEAVKADTLIDRIILAVPALLTLAVVLLRGRLLARLAWLAERYERKK